MLHKYSLRVLLLLAERGNGRSEYTLQPNTLNTEHNMDPSSLVEAVSGFDNTAIQQLLDQTHRDAHNAKNNLASLREHLITATRSPERIAEELASIDSRIAKEIATHQNSMKQLAQIRERWSQPTDEAREAIEKAKNAAAEAARLFNAVNMVAAAKSIASSFPAGTDFSEILSEKVTAE